MKKFDIPEIYKSDIIAKVKTKRKIEDPRKKDFTPTVLDFGKVKFNIARHFGFCYGVENAIEIAYRAINENPNKKIYLLSQMIHNPEVNQDLKSQGLEFIQDTEGNQLISWDNIEADDIVIIPAFGTTIETEDKLKTIGVDVQKYNTTCPFVEKVWNRSEKLGNEDFTIIIHGKSNHEETKATFSHSKQNAPSLIVKDIEETRFLCDFILGKVSEQEFLSKFSKVISPNFDPELDLKKVGVVNQTTMLATETQEIANMIQQAMIDKYGKDQIKEHFADTRDTLCYATNDNQSSTYGLLEVESDIAIVIGGYNSSNTTHLVELLETKIPTFFINNALCFDAHEIEHFNIHTKKIEKSTFDIKSYNKIAVTSGASCPDAIVDEVLHKVLTLNEIKIQDLNSII